MDMKELDRRAKHQEKMPKGLKGYEQCYYIASRGLYEQYAKGSISLEQAREEKVEVVKRYQEGQEAWEYFVKLHTINHQLKQLHEQGFDTILEYEIREALETLL